MTGNALDATMISNALIATTWNLPRTMPDAVQIDGDCEGNRQLIESDVVETTDGTRVRISRHPFSQEARQGLGEEGVILMGIALDARLMTYDGAHYFFSPTGARARALSWRRWPKRFPGRRCGSPRT